MGLDLPERTRWGERALQGLAFWIGHRRAMFEGYPLPEAALVAEACVLLRSALHSDKVLLCERMYRNLLPANGKRKVLKKRDRVDLTIANREIGSAQKGELTQHIEYIIEVKRASAPWPLIQKDMRRLHEALTLAGNSATMRALLFVVSEAARPERLVTENGDSMKKPHKIDDCDGYYLVRRTCKASSRFETVNEAHYASLIEVFTYKPQPIKKD
jgi:hypothetical protein